jgi:hemerythrin
MKKLSALMSFPENRFEEFFVPVDLTEGEWNRVDGMEVLPAYSPHPVDTTILFFRALCKEGFKTYAHFADIASFEVLKKLKKGAKSALGKEIDRRVRETYLSPANLKKIDAGGGMIHGNAEDFRQDDSDKIVLSHIDRPLTLNEKEIGSNSSFGMQDILIRREHSLYDPLIPRAVEELYPSVPKEEREVLENCPVRMYTVGSIIIKRGAANDTVYLLLKGLVELIAAELDIRNVLNPGALFGEYSAYSDTPSDRTYRADSFVLTLEIPSHLYRLFLERSGLVQRAEMHLPRKHFLQSTPLFGDSISGALQDRMASYLREKEFGNRKKVKPPKESCLFLVEKGAVDIKFNGKKLDTVIRGGYFGEDQVLGNPLFEYETVEDTQLFCVPASALEEVPIVRWKLLESLNKRIRTKDAIFPV